MIDLPKTYPSWIFDDSPIDDPLGYGERVVNFIRHLKHPKSNRQGHGFVFDPWQERIVRRICAPRHKNGSRIVKTVFAMIPRGNRKTSLGVALTLLHTIGPERTSGGQVIYAAADRKQARIAFEEAIGIIREDRRLVPLIEAQDYRNRLTDKRSHSILEAISADAKTQHGRTPTFTLMDELHSWPKRDLWEALISFRIKSMNNIAMRF